MGVIAYRVFCFGYWSNYFTNVECPDLYTYYWAVRFTITGS
jgi:hypothetical protein